jgi:thioredoxin reductase (NADPH)
MRKSQLVISVLFIACLLAVNLASAESFEKSLLGGLPWYGWAGTALFLALLAAGLAARDAARARRLLEETPAASQDELHVSQLPQELRQKYDPDGPPYPHPVVITERCIGCHACVDACPHDVLAIVNGVATPVAREQCMEDTSCQVECPVNPKACIVVNTTKQITPRKVPSRDSRYETNVPGCYIVGDVSGTPLIKNAANEGADVIRHVAEGLRAAGDADARADYDVAIIGVGPAGLSAAITAQGLGLRYVAVEQERALATIEAYPSNKYVFFKPDAMESRGAIEVAGAGAQREEILNAWMRAMRESGVRINEFESCKAVRRAEDGGDHFVVETERGEGRGRASYSARRVVLALGNRGTPMRLKVPGEDLKVSLDGRPEEKVRYRLADPEAVRRRRVVVVGAGNSAVEAAVDLVARRSGDRITFRADDEINEVTLVVRSDMKNDLKFLNKRQIYDCIDEGKITAHFGTTIKEIREREVVLMNARTGEETMTVPNDLVYALIGGDRPTRFLESIGIRIA